MRKRQRSTWWQLVKETWREAPTRGRAWRYYLEYAAVRIWTVLLCCFSIDVNLKFARLLGNLWWLGIAKNRRRAMDHLRQALGDRFPEDRLREIGRRSFEHWAQVYLVELALTPALITPRTWARYVTLYELAPALRELLKTRGVIMLTAHFGNFELLGFVLAKLGLPMTALMRPLDNPLLNDFLLESREAGGIHLLYKKGATQSADNVVAGGGTLSFIADQDAGRKAVFSDFFGRKASWYKSIGLLAIHRRVPILVGCAVRERPGLHYGIHVERIIQPEEWESQPQPLQWITDAFAGALETGIRRHPEQYLWIHRRWKSRPPEERASTGATREITSA